MLKQFIKFGMVGIIGFFVDSYALYGFMDFLGLDLYVGRLASYLVAATATWALNRIFTFPTSRDNYSNKRKQWGKFFIS